MNEIIQVPVSPELKQRLQLEAKSQGQSLAAYVRLLIIHNKVRVTYEPPSQPLPTLN